MNNYVGVVEKVIDKNQIWVASYDISQQSIKRVDATTGQILGTIDLLTGRCTSMKYNAVNGCMYVFTVESLNGTAYETRLLKISTTTNIIVLNQGVTALQTVAEAYNSVVINSSTNMMFASSNNRVLKYNLATDVIEGRYSPDINGGFGDVVINTSNKEIWLCLPSISKIALLNQNDGTVIKQVAVSDAVSGTYCSDNNTLWFVGGTGYTSTSGTVACIHGASHVPVLYKNGIGGAFTKALYHDISNTVWVYDNYSGSLMSLQPSNGEVQETFVLSPNLVNGMIMDELNSSIWYTTTYSTNKSKLYKKLISVVTSGTVIGTHIVGNMPISLAYDSANNVMWVANNESGNGTVSKLNIFTGTTIGEYPVGNSTYDIVYDHVNGVLWSANRNPGSVSKINTVTGAVIATYSLGSGTFTEAITYDSANNAVWVANSGNDTVSKISAATGVVLATYTVNEAPADIAYDHINNVIWVCNYGSGNISKLSASTGSLLATYTTQGNPQRIAYDSASNALWISSINVNGIVKMNAATGDVIGTYLIGANSVYAVTYIAADNSVWVSSGGSGLSGYRVNKLHAATGAVLGTYDYGVGTNDIAYDPINNAVWLSNSVVNTVTKTAA